MRVLVTGSSGWLASTMVPLLRARGHAVVGLDPKPGPLTDVVGSIAERDLVFSTVRDHRPQAIVHSGAMHKPDIATHTCAEFIAVNIQGTLNLLEAATAPGTTVDRLIMTSTTSLMISGGIRAGRAGGATAAAWINEDTEARPRNIYGVTKLSAEHLCRMFHEQRGLPVLVLRTARFFPERDDMAHAIAQSDANTKANEFLFRRLTVEDAAACHLVALDKAPDIGFDVFIVSAPTPFKQADCARLIVDAPAVVADYFPQYREIYDRLGWTMFASVDRVYDASRAAARLGFTCRTGFAQILAGPELAG